MLLKADVELCDAQLLFYFEPGISVKTGNSLPILPVFFSTLFIPVYVVGRKYGTNLVNKK